MELLNNGLLLLIIGMGTVFAFLGIMVLAIGASARLCARYAHLLPEKHVHKPKRPAPAPAGGDGVLMAVISAAIKRYRDEH